MKTILVDAWNSFVKEDGVDIKMKVLLDSYPNNKIIVTNANDDERVKFGITNMPYPVFSLAHKPNKTDSDYFSQLLNHFNLNINEVVYFEHNEEASNAARSVNIPTLWFKKNEDLNVLKTFLDNNL
ncbi:hypothetical protein [Pontimicrobium sp. IMCC45349]|jgi:predicted HAD superfamily phosphohydrolase YqeG|uniref:hypothetical protein n=1 Tax=Pontimicrobium sp. IMCC45349 TaxID=3391574 RepID=UPI0039A0450F